LPRRQNKEKKMEEDESSDRRAPLNGQMVSFETCMPMQTDKDK
jgi:hypothetical protein